MYAAIAYNAQYLVKDARETAKESTVVINKPAFSLKALLATVFMTNRAAH